MAIIELDSPEELKFTEVDIDEFDALYISIDGVDSSNRSHKYPAHEHAHKTIAHLGTSSGLIYLLGSPEVDSEDSDQPLPFKQRRYFNYLSGVDFPDCTLAYGIGTDHLTLFIPPPDPRSVIWNGATPSKEECEKAYEVDEVKYTTDVEAYVKRWREKNPHETLYLLHPDHAPAGFKEESDAKVDSTSLISAIDNARVIKSSYEVDLLRKACEISSLAHLEVLKNMGSVTNERHIESLFIAKCMWHDAKKQAYGVIAASGANASTLHYIANEDNLDGREMMLLDAGCEWKNYCSDVTRTFPISGKMSKAGKEVYKVVDDMQKACLAITKPGTTFRELQELSMREGIKGLLNLKVLKGEFKDILESGVGSVFYPHGLGHHIGLETHDVSSTATPRTSTSSKKKSSKSFSELHITDSSEPFKPGMVITVEPGIYFNVYALEAVKEDKIKSSFVDWDVVNKYIKVGGVRIEDDVLITEDGHETLTKGAPKGEEACKIVRESRAAAEEKRAKETKRKTSYMSGW